MKRNADGRVEEEQPSKMQREAPRNTPKVNRLGRLTEMEVWGLVAKCGELTEAENPFALQRISNVTDYIDQLLDPTQVEQARKAQLRKLWDKKAFTPILEEQVPKGSQVFNGKWVDKCSKGIYKSRLMQMSKPDAVLSRNKT